MSSAERVLEVNEGVSRPRLTIIQGERLPESPLLVATDKHLEAIKTGLANRTIPFGLFEDLESEHQMMLRLYRHKLMKELPNSIGPSRPDRLEGSQIRIARTDLLGDDLADAIVSYKPFPSSQYEYYSQLSVEEIRDKATQVGVFDSLWASYPEVNPSKGNNQWMKIIENHSRVLTLEQREDAIAIGRDFYLVNGVAPTGEYLEELIKLGHLPSSRTLFGTLFEDKAEFQASVTSAVAHAEALESEKQSRYSLIAEIERSAPPAELFETDEGSELSEDERLQRFARYMVACFFINPHRSNDPKEAQQARIDISKRNVISDKNGKSFYSRIMNRNLAAKMDGDTTTAPSTISRGDIQAYITMQGLIDYVDPGIRSKHEKMLRKIKERVDERTQSPKK